MSVFLIADDSPTKTALLEAFVKKSGMNVDIVRAATSEEAKKMIDAHETLQYAFIDYEFPSENGPAVIAYLRKKHPAAKIALVTSYDGEKYKKEAMEAGAQAFICTLWEDDIVKKALTDLLELWKSETPT